MKQRDELVDNSSPFQATSSFSELQKKLKRPYTKIADDCRIQLLRMVNFIMHLKVEEEKKTLKEASKILSINYCSAKTVMQTYRKKGRIRKKLTRDRKEKLPKISHPKFLKKIFSIQKVIKQNKSIPEQIEQEKPLPGNSDFSFKCYQIAIASALNIHYETQMRNLQHIKNRALPIPDFTNKKY